MCGAITHQCSCGHGVASLHHANSVLPDDVVAGVHCPDCTASVVFNPATMLRDNGWVIEYDMELATDYLAARGVEAELVTPEYLFDEGFSTWNGLTPTDAYDKAMEMHELLAESEGDTRAYFEALKRWTIERTSRLAEQGWRKARLAL